MGARNVALRVQQFAASVAGVSGESTLYPKADGKWYTRSGTGAEQLVGPGAGGSALDAYPVGSVYLAVVATNPGTLFGGTWAAFGQGRALVGVDVTQTEFDSVQKTGGEKAHTMTEAEMPSHEHALDADFTVLGTVGASGGTTENSGTSVAQGTPGGRFVHPVAVTGTTTNKGGGAAMNILQPYITVYMWRRTA